MDGGAGKDDTLLIRFWKQLEGEVEQLLRIHKDELLSLAESLLDKSELSHDEVLALLGSNVEAAASEPALDWYQLRVRERDREQATATFMDKRRLDGPSVATDSSGDQV